MLPRCSLIEPPSLSARFNLIDVLLLEHLRRGREDRPALGFEGLTISYGQLAQRTMDAVELLQSAGVGRADRIGLIIPDVPAFVYLLLAAASLGAIAVPINPKHNATDAIEPLRHVGARTVFVHESVAHEVRIAADVTLRSIVVDSLLESGMAGGGRFPRRELVPEGTLGGDVLYLLFSSGTTGRSKAIPRRHADIPWTATAFAHDVLRMSESDRVLAVPKLTFGYALVGNLLFSLLHGAMSILIPQPSSAATICDAILAFKPSIFLAQPRMLAELADGMVSREDLAEMRTVVSAGDVLSEPVRQRWVESTGLDVIDGFGSTEVGHIFLCSNALNEPPEAEMRPLRGYETKIIDDLGAEVADETPGRLCIRGASVCSSYWNDPERTQHSFVDGWFVSDDMFIRKDAAYAYVGRRDDLIKTGCGEWIAPLHVEGLLLQDPGVCDCAVIGAHDERDVVRVKAYVVRTKVREPDSVLAARLQRLAEHEWPMLEHMRIHMIEFVEAIPRSVNGKIQRHRLAPRSLTEFAYEC